MARAGGRSVASPSMHPADRPGAVETEAVMSAMQDAHRRRPRVGRRPSRARGRTGPAGFARPGPESSARSCSPRRSWPRRLSAASEYSPIAEPVSALEAGPNGWVQQVNFVVFGVLTIAFALGLHRGLRPTRAGIVGPALLFLSGIGLSARRGLPAAGGRRRRDLRPGRPHRRRVHVLPDQRGRADRRVASTGARPEVAEPRRRTRSPPGSSRSPGSSPMGALVMPDDAPLHDWAGLASECSSSSSCSPAASSSRSGCLPQQHRRRFPS